MTPGGQVEDRRARLLAFVQGTPSPVRKEVQRRDLGTVVAAMLVSLLAFLVVGGLHASQRPLSLVLTAASSWAVIAAIASGLALRRGRAMLGTPRGSLLAIAVLVPGLLASAWFLLPSSLVWTVVPHGVGVDVRCFAVTLLLAAAPFLAFLRMRREGDPVAPGITGAALGAAAGAWGAVLIDLHCEMTDPRHVLMGHVLPVAILGSAGALLARSALAIRARK